MGFGFARASASLSSALRSRCCAAGMPLNLPRRTYAHHIPKSVFGSYLCGVGAPRMFGLGEVLAFGGLPPRPALGRDFVALPLAVPSQFILVAIVFILLLLLLMRSVYIRPDQTSR